MIGSVAGTSRDVGAKNRRECRLSKVSTRSRPAGIGIDSKTSEFDGDMAARSDIASGIERKYADLSTIWAGEQSTRHRGLGTIATKKSGNPTSKRDEVDVIRKKSSRACRRRDRAQ